jgi:hypothetical protein
MRRLWLASIVFTVTTVLYACSSSSSQSAPAPLDNMPDREDSGPGDDAGDDVIAPADDGGADAEDDAPIDPGPPAEQYIGRFGVSDPGGLPLAAWPGVRAVARFDGTQVSVRLGQTDGFSGGPSWFEVFVDGARKAPFSVAGSVEDHELASGLAPGAHTVEIVKRTEANLGAVEFGGFTFTGGTGLLSPPLRPSRRIEFLSDSTIDGFGVEGTYPCAGGGPPQFNNATKSTAYYAAKALKAEHFLLSYSGKGLTKNQDPGDLDFYRGLYAKTIPDDPVSSWAFASWTPDAVVISLGGTDYDGANGTPPGFEAAYGDLVDDIRGKYAGAHVYMTIWAQIKDDGVNDSRTHMKTALDSVIAGRAADTKLHVFVFPESDPALETGCYAHGSDALHQAAAAQLVTKLKADLGW